MFIQLLLQPSKTHRSPGFARSIQNSHASVRLLFRLVIYSTPFHLWVLHFPVHFSSRSRVNIPNFRPGKSCHSCVSLFLSFMYMYPIISGTFVWFISLIISSPLFSLQSLSRTPNSLLLVFVLCFFTSSLFYLRFLSLTLLFLTFRLFWI